jgi:hypothetical protein
MKPIAYIAYPLFLIASVIFSVVVLLPLFLIYGLPREL